MIDHRPFARANPIAGIGAAAGPYSISRKEIHRRLFGDMTGDLHPIEHDPAILFGYKTFGPDEGEPIGSGDAA
jgi:hypothetical protein